MKNFLSFWLLLALKFLAPSIIYSNSLVVNLEKQQQEKMKLCIALIDPSDQLKLFAQVVIKDISCCQQKLSGFDVALKEYEKVPSKRVLRELAGEGFPLVIFLQEDKGKKNIEWRIYDAVQASMHKGKRMVYDIKNSEHDAHRLADNLWLALTGQEGIFSTKIAYCVEKNKEKHRGSDIYIKRPYEDKQTLLVSGGKLLAPRWNKHKEKPLLLYSEVTPENIRLMATTMQGNRNVVSNFEGLTMLPSFSLDGQRVVYCGSYKGTTQLYYCAFDSQKKKRTIRRMTHNNGNNTSPSLLENGDIVFCSDFESKTPQVYYLHSTTGFLERLTDLGYCASPHFCPKNNTIVYCKLVGSVMQLFSFDLVNKKHTQLTFNSGNKDECCWSPCGNYIAFAVDTGKTSRIAMLNCITNEQSFITPESQRAIYPSWSMSTI